MYRHRLLTVIALALCLGLADAALAGFAATDCFLPSVGRGPGKQESEWYTRVLIHNPGDTDATIQIIFLLRGQPNPAPQVFTDTVLAGKVGRYIDPVETLFGTTGFGALRVVSDQPVVVLGRVYSQPPEGPAYSVGQFFAAIPAEFAIGAGEHPHLLGVWQHIPETSSYFRYNYGLVETAGATATVEISSFNADGEYRTTRSFTLGPFEVQQRNVAELLNGENAWNMRLEIRVTGGDGRIVAFGSFLANESNDPSTFEMQYPSRILAGGGAR